MEFTRNTVQAIQEVPELQNPIELKPFLGLVNNGKFIPDKLCQCCQPTEAIISQAKADYGLTLVFRVKAQSCAMANTANMK